MATCSSILPRKSTGRRAWATVNGVTRIGHDLVTEPPPPYIPTNIVSLKIIVQLLSCVQFFVTPWTAACQAFLYYTTSWSLLKLMSTDLVMLVNHFILCPLLLLPSIFPRIKVFSNESVLCMRWPGYGASASTSVFPVNIQG